MSVEEPKSGKSKTRRIGLKSFLGGSLLASEKALKHMPFVFFIAFLAILMISNRYWSEKTIRKMEAVQDSIKELRAESVTYETELMKMNRPSEIVNKVKASGLDLLEPTEPARKLNVENLEEE
ncbi:FtsL-like putative cell division protein [uncultured Sunxiuqinia sp.]|uniref:FtsL-like putative cell division protein n=1 Tax=uncultured Sunxiuqinia sp. TaxID=1573825 RepID=UPI00261C5A72|nr:FtsL-like putative cell division protein [uncultured Sunxiuqinia sp.]